MRNGARAGNQVPLPCSFHKSPHPLGIPFSESKKKKKNQLIAPPTSQPLPQPLSLALCGQLERFDAASGHFACHLLILLYAFHFPNCGHNFVAHGLPFVVNGSA